MATNIHLAADKKVAENARKSARRASDVRREPKAHFAKLPPSKPDYIVISPTPLPQRSVDPDGIERDS